MNAMGKYSLLILDNLESSHVICRSQVLLIRFEMPFEDMILSHSILMRYIESTNSCHILAHHLLAHHLLAHHLHNYRQFKELGQEAEEPKSQRRKKSRKRKKITKIPTAIQRVYMLQLISFIAENNQLASYSHLMYLEYYS